MPEGSGLGARIQSNPLSQEQAPSQAKLGLGFVHYILLPSALSCIKTDRRQRQSSLHYAYVTGSYSLPSQYYEPVRSDPS